MKSIDLFFQGEGLDEIKHLAIEVGTTFGVIKSHVSEKYNIPTEAFLFAEDVDEPLDDNERAVDRTDTMGLKLHLNSCIKVEVAVTFNGETVHCHFAPSATVGRVKKWIAEFKLKMSDAEAGEHVLQILGTYERPAPGTHIGVLSLAGTCEIKFDLVPDERVNGAPRS